MMGNGESGKPFLLYQNCLRKFYHNTDTQILLYLARSHYEAEQWQECKKSLLRAIHLAPSNYTLRFDVGVALQKFSASTLQKPKRTVDEVRSTVAELKNAVRVFSQLSAASSYHTHGFDEKKIETHEQWKSVSIPSTKRKERTQGEDDESGDGGRRRKKGGKRRRKEKKSKTRFEQEQEEEEAEMEDEHEEVDGEDVNPMNDQEDEEDRTRDNFVAAGLKDSDAEEDVGAPSNRKRRAWSESDEEDDHPSEPNPNSSSGRDRENSSGSDEEARGDEEEANEE
ncbi:uncharacterized protein A4U43_C06F10230 [Asparagus officinalis]|uniref:Uncharacterized protein n=1 Tax=Asparagus officinalis TaxID=4686 RepID=A0A5P1EKU4_ASPOF|nr:uncharacterized protein A4U43_C06F10230 [Asparagus officinalis]